MKYRAIAVATERSNAVGTVELECRPEGLVLVYLGVGAFNEGYAPAAVTSGTRLCVPWPQVEEALVEGDRLFLAFDQALGPHSRLMLANFSSGTRVHHHELYRRRILVRTAGLGAAAIFALLSLAVVARIAPDRGPSLAITVAVLSAAAILGVAFFADRFLSYGGIEADAAREALAGELMAYLPALVRAPAAPPRPKPARTLADFQGFIPRTTFAIVITLTASGLGAVVMARYLITNEEAPRKSESATVQQKPDLEQQLAAAPVQPAPAAPPPKLTAAKDSDSAPTSAPTGDSATLSEACRCARADSPLWAEPLPRLTIMVISHKVRQGHGEDESVRKKYSELELAVINNSNQEIKEVSLLVLFYKREQGKERELVSNRPLFFEGPLVPAQAIKWGVTAEGTEFEVQNPILGTIGEGGEEAAPADRVAELLTANHRPVRLHGALLLTLLGDRRAKEGVLRLKEALNDAEAPYLTRLLDAERDVRVCHLQPRSNGSVKACLFNASGEPKKDLGVKLRALAGLPNHEVPTAEPPALIAENTLAIPGELAPDTGVVFTGSFPGAAQGAKAYEAVADRLDLLR